MHGANDDISVRHSQRNHDRFENYRGCRSWVPDDLRLIAHVIDGRAGGSDDNAGKPDDDDSTANNDSDVDHDNAAHNYCDIDDDDQQQHDVFNHEQHDFFNDYVLHDQQHDNRDSASKHNDDKLDRPSH